MTAALAFTPDDYRLPPETPTLKVKVRCGCGVRSRPFNIVTAALDILRRARPEPSLVVGSWYCNDCKETVKVFARNLHLTD